MKLLSPARMNDMNDTEEQMNRLEWLRIRKGSPIARCGALALRVALVCGVWRVGHIGIEGATHIYTRLQFIVDLVNTTEIKSVVSNSLLSHMMALQLSQVVLCCVQNPHFESKPAGHGQIERQSQTLSVYRILS